MQAGQRDTRGLRGCRGPSGAADMACFWRAGVLESVSQPVLSSVWVTMAEDLPPQPLVQKNTEGSPSLWGVMDAGGSWSPSPEGTFPKAA